MKINFFHILWLIVIIGGSWLVNSTIPQDWHYLFGFIEGSITFALLDLAKAWNNED